MSEARGLMTDKVKKTSFGREQVFSLFFFFFVPSKKNPRVYLPIALLFRAPQRCVTFLFFLFYKASQIKI